MNNTTTPNKKDSGQLINEKIRSPYLQLITHEGENIGVVAKDRALQMAADADLDLVQISDEGKEGVPVAKIMDLGKTLYERKKKQSDAKKNQKVIQIKEIKMRPKIGEHDYHTKLKQMIQFLKEGKRVKITLTFRGRENVQREEKGQEFFARCQQALEESGFADNLTHDKDDVSGKLWSRMYYLKKI